MEDDEFDKCMDVLGRKAKYLPPELQPYGKAFSRLDGVANQFDGVNSDVHDEELQGEAFGLQQKVMEKALEEHREYIMREASF
jgi:hypothetical protein